MPLQRRLPLTLPPLKIETPVTLTATPGGTTSLAEPKIAESVILVSPGGKDWDVKLPVMFPKMATATLPSRIAGPREISLEVNRAMVVDSARPA
jgi:hypothetical protein